VASDPPPPWTLIPNPFPRTHFCPPPPHFSLRGEIVFSLFSFSSRFPNGTLWHPGFRASAASYRRSPCRKVTFGPKTVCATRQNPGQPDASFFFQFFFTHHFFFCFYTKPRFAKSSRPFPSFLARNVFVLFPLSFLFDHHPFRPVTGPRRFTLY